MMALPPLARAVGVEALPPLPVRRCGGVAANHSPVPSVWSSPRLTAGECRAQGACLGRPRRRNQLRRQSVASAWGNSPALRARRYEHDVAAPQSALLPSPVYTGTTRGGCPTSYATAIAGATTGRAYGWTRRNRSGRGFNDRRFDQPSREARPLFPTTVIHVTPEPARSNLGSRKGGKIRWERRPPSSGRRRRGRTRP